jgi:uncharacterized protein YjbI with pentapeptide repeats
MTTCTNNEVLFTDINGQRHHLLFNDEPSHDHQPDIYYDGFNMSGDYSGIFFNKAICVDSNMKLANFEEAELIGADLRECNFEGANLSGANLRGVNLDDANLRNADLRGVNLDDANLRNADLRGVNLDGANLSGADLRGVNLDGANLSGVILDDANLTNVDFDKCHSLQGMSIDNAKVTYTKQNAFKFSEFNIGIHWQ